MGILVLAAFFAAVSILMHMRADSGSRDAGWAKIRSGECAGVAILLAAYQLGRFFYTR